MIEPVSPGTRGPLAAESAPRLPLTPAQIVIRMLVLNYLFYLSKLQRTGVAIVIACTKANPVVGWPVAGIAGHCGAWPRKVCPWVHDEL